MKTAVAAVSLANLLLMRIWVELLGEQVDPAPQVWYGAALLTLSLLALSIWAIAKWGGVAGRVLLATGASALLIKATTLSAGHRALQMKGWVAGLVENGLSHGWLWPAGFVFALAAGWLMMRIQLRWIVSALVMLSPIVFVTAGQSAWRLMRATPPEAAFQPSPAGPPSNGARVVWIIFDELDERIAFSQRPTHLELPAFDTLERESIVFRQAFGQSNSTAEVIPALLGDLLERSHFAGHRTGLVGWFLPYCRLYGKQLDACEAWRMDRQLNSYGTGLFEVVRNQLRSLAESSLYSLFGQSLAVEAHARTIAEMENAAIRMATRPDLDLVILHLPVPHQPFVYDPVRQTLTAANQDSRGYLASLQLADRIFGHLRASLVKAGLWQRTNVLLTGDHGFRQAERLGFAPGDLHVPWLWKPAGDGRPRCVNQRFETRGTGALVSRILAGESAERVFAGYP